MAKENDDDQRMKRRLSGIADTISNNVKDHNIVFRQMASNLIIVSGILLALATQVVGSLAESSLMIKLLAVIILLTLNASIMFGILQHLLEANYFKKGALLRIDLVEDVLTGKISNTDEVKGARDTIVKQMGKSVTRWPTYTQMALLGSGIVLITITSTIFLFM